MRVSEQENQIKRLHHERDCLLDEIDRYRAKLRKYVSLVKNGSLESLDYKSKGTL